MLAQWEKSITQISCTNVWKCSKVVEQASLMNTVTDIADKMHASCGNAYCIIEEGLRYLSPRNMGAKEAYSGRKITESFVDR
jgi:hypothetical protein